MTRLAECCHIALEDSEERITHKYGDDLECRLCGNPIVSSRSGKYPDRLGGLMTCPLCVLTVVGGQLTRHCDDLAALQKAARALLEETLEGEPTEAQKAVLTELEKHRPWPW